MSTRTTIKYWSTFSKGWPYICRHKYHDIVDDGIYIEWQFGVFRGTSWYKTWSHTRKVGELVHA